MNADEALELVLARQREAARLTALYDLFEDIASAASNTLRPETTDAERAVSLQRFDAGIAGCRAVRADRQALRTSWAVEDQRRNIPDE